MVSSLNRANFFRGLIGSLRKESRARAHQTMLSMVRDGHRSSPTIPSLKNTVVALTESQEKPGQDSYGNDRKSQEKARRSQEEPGRARRSQEPFCLEARSQDASRTQEEAGGARPLKGIQCLDSLQRESWGLVWCMSLGLPFCLEGRRGQGASRTQEEPRGAGSQEAYLSFRQSRLLYLFFNVTDERTNQPTNQPTN